METGQKQSSPNKKSSKDILLKEVASRLSNEIIFKEKIERAKSYLQQASFSVSISPRK